MLSGEVRLTPCNLLVKARWEALVRSSKGSMGGSVPPCLEQVGRDALETGVWEPTVKCLTP